MYTEIMETFSNLQKILITDLEKTALNDESICIMAEDFSFFGLYKLIEKFETADSVKIMISNTNINKFFDAEFDVSLEDRFNQINLINRILDLLKDEKVQIKKIESIGYGNIAIGKNWYMLLAKCINAKVFGFSEESQESLPINKNTEDENPYYKIEFDKLWNNPKKAFDIKFDFIDNLNHILLVSPKEIYYHLLKQLFEEKNEDIKETEIEPDLTEEYKKTKIWELMFQFQKDAVQEILTRLENLGVCILADSVGLGKTFSALGVIKYYLLKRKRVLVLCPKKLENNWKTFTKNYRDNLLANDDLNFEVYFHTDMNRHNQDLDRVDWGNFDLVVIDESHNFRSGFSDKKDKDGNTKTNRYSFLLNQVINSGRETKLLLLSATPVNNRFNDLKNQLQLAYNSNKRAFTKKLGINSIDGTFKSAEIAFDKWSKGSDSSSVDDLIKWLNPDFVSVLEKVSIARSREHIKKFYNANDIGTFPERKKPIDIDKYQNDIFDYSYLACLLDCLSLSVYSPSIFIKKECKNKYPELFESAKTGIKVSQYGREKGIEKLMSANLLKRLESSIDSFKLTCSHVQNEIINKINFLNNYEIKKENTKVQIDNISKELRDVLEDDENIILATDDIKISLDDINIVAWIKSLKEDLEIFTELEKYTKNFTAQTDSKLQTLKSEIEKKINYPINDNNKKIIIFTAFSDTASYIYDNIYTWLKEKFNLHTALITGKGCRSTLDITDFNKILMYFSPESKHRDLIYPNENKEFDILVATDCISEGQNLQDCDWLINYDIHWNPVRIVQRFGRIDRIGSKNSKIQLENFWPSVNLDIYINLHSRTEKKMAALNIAATGDENILTNERSFSDIRAAQLEKIKNEQLDDKDIALKYQLEELKNGNLNLNNSFSITDIGLSGFKTEYKRLKEEYKDIIDFPNGLACCVNGSALSLPNGTIFVFKEKSGGKEETKKKRHFNILYPYYIVYIKENGIIFSIDGIQNLNTIRKLSKITNFKSIDYLSNDILYIAKKALNASDNNIVVDSLLTGYTVQTNRKKKELIIQIIIYS